VVSFFCDPHSVVVFSSLKKKESLGVLIQDIIMGFLPSSITHRPHFSFTNETSNAAL
jgi:hypothetical protein